MPELIHHLEIDGVFQPSKIWIYRNFLDADKVDLVGEYLKRKVERNTLLSSYERRTFNFQGENIKVGGQFFDRPYQKLWAVTHDDEYVYQTPETIEDWSNAYIDKNVDPICKYLIQEARKVEPFNSDPSWIATRGIINILEPGRQLEAHYDGDELDIDVMEHQVHSFTYYVNGGQGGDFWAEDKDGKSWRYSPQPNDALIVQGTGVWHGVTRVKDSTRVCTTFRFLNKSQMNLPGDPSKLLWRN